MNKNVLQVVFISTIFLLSFTGLIAQKGNVNITAFTVSIKGQKVLLNWNTNGTVTTNYFAIQKSTDGINYKTVALVLGSDPKQKDSDCYGCFDKYVSKTAKHSYYRLVHIDTDGNEQISEAKILTKP